MSILVFVGPESHNGKAGRQVILKGHDGKEYRDRIDVGSGFQREQMLLRAAGHWDLEPAAMLCLDREIVREADREDKRAAESDKPAATVEYERITARELATTDYNLAYLVEGVLVEGQPCIIGGPSKGMKTAIAVDLAVSLAVGGYFLGRFKVNRPCRPALMSCESGKATLKNRALSVAAAARYRLEDLNIIFSGQVPVFSSLPHLDALGRFLADDERDVLIVDPVGRAMAGCDRPGDMFAQYKELAPITDLCERMGVTLVVCHHTKKRGVADRHDKPTLGDLQWSGFEQWCRQWLLLNRRSDFEPGTETHHHELWLEVGGSAGHASSWLLDIDEAPDTWGVELRPSSELKERREDAKAAREQEGLEADRRQIVECTVKLAGPATQRDIRGRAGLGNGKRFDRAWFSLLDDGTVIEDGMVGKGNGQKYPAYRLKVEGDE